MRLAPLVLVGCVWVGDRNALLRLDDDGDGVPQAMDCDDRDPSRWALESDTELRCGERIERGALELDLMAVTTCRHPQIPESLLEMTGELEAIVQVRVDAPSHVRVRLQGDVWEANASLATHALLIANRGSVCSEDACVPGLPLANEVPPTVGGDVTLTVDSSVSFDAVPSEPWFVLVSGVDGFTLGVDCDPGGA